MRRALEQGLSAAEAARLALDETRSSETSSRLLASIRAYDEATAHAVLDESLAAFRLDTVLRKLVPPTLRRIGVDATDGVPAHESP
jgi:hypothetical protein